MAKNAQKGIKKDGLKTGVGREKFSASERATNNIDQGEGIDAARAKDQRTWWKVDYMRKKKKAW